MTGQHEPPRRIRHCLCKSPTSLGLVINAFSNRVGFPFIAKMAHLPIAEFRCTFLRYRLRALLAGATLLCLMVHLGGFLVTKMYDSRYHAASWMVPVLALGLWHTLLYTTTYPALLSLGKPQYGTLGNACYCVSVVTAIFDRLPFLRNLRSSRCSSLPETFLYMW